MRQFVSSCPPDKNGKIILTEKDYRYLVHVLRLKAGSKIEVSFPDGAEALMQIDYNSESNKTVGAELSLLVTSEKEQSVFNRDATEEPEFIVFQFLPKGPKMDLIVRQSTECGASLIVPIIGEYSVVGKKQDSCKENKNKLERWERIIREARQQSGSKMVTKIVSPCGIDDAMKIWAGINGCQKKAFVLCEKDDGQ